MTKSRCKTTLETPKGSTPASQTATSARLAVVAGCVSLPLLVLVNFYPALRGAVFAHSDICFFFEPMKAFMHEELRAGRLPLWSPYIFCGYPIAAEGQSAVFYPPSLLFSWLLPSFQAVTWLVLTHLMLAGIGVYLFALARRVNPPGALLSALVFALSGYLLAHSHHVSLVCAAAWLPWTLLFVERAWRGNLLRNATGAALCWGAAALGGHPQTLFHITVAVLFLITWRTVASRALGLRVVARKGVALLALVLAIGVGLAAVQLLMTMELSRSAPHGERGTLDYVTSFSLLPPHLLGLFNPNWQGSVADKSYQGERYFWEYVLFIGVIPLLLAVIGAFRREGRIWLVLASGALVLALAQRNPLYHLLRFLPGFADFRVPARWILLFTFGAALLAGQGLEQLESLLPRLPKVKLSQQVAAWVTLMLVAISIIPLARFDRSVAPLADAAAFRGIPIVVNAVRADEHWGRALILPPISIFADWSPPQGWAGSPEGWMEARAYLPADVPQSYGLPIVGGYAGFVSPRQAAFFGLAEAARHSAEVGLYSLVGTRHFVMPPSTSIAGLPSVEVPPFRLFQNDSSFPRAFATANSSPADSDEAAREGVMKLSREDALREKAITRGGAAISGKSAEIISVKEPRPEHIIIQAHVSGQGLVVLNERWDPGWRAFVDGRPAPLYETDCVLLGAPVTEGNHTVTFRYQPRSFIIGRAISLASLAVCVGLLLAPIRRRQSSPAGSGG